MNSYSDLTAFKSFLKITDASRDADLLWCLEAASRSVDEFTRRFFYVKTDTRIYDGERSSRLRVDDLLSVASVGMDTTGDGVFNNEAWVEGTDYNLWPWNKVPARELWIAPGASKSFPTDQRSIQIAGEFGYGDKNSADPVRLTSITGTIADATVTALTLSTTDGVIAGQTIRIETERMYVSSVSGTTATVERGVNGSTAATHSAKPISVYLYPISVVRMTRIIAGEIWRTLPNAGIVSESIGGEYSYTLSSARNSDAITMNVLGDFIRRARV